MGSQGVIGCLKLDFMLLICLLFPNQIPKAEEPIESIEIRILFTQKIFHYRMVSAHNHF